MNRLFAALVALCFIAGLASAPASAASRKTSEANRSASASKTTSKTTKKTVVASSGKSAGSQKRRPVVQAAVPVKPSFGQLAGLHGASDPLDLKSSVALVMDQDTREVLFSKNDSAVLPIASLTKLMTGLIVTEARLPMDEMIVISQDDVDTEKGSRSRLKVGAQLSRGELLHLALMSSENRAAHALGRTYPGGLNTFVGLMNTRAQACARVFISPTNVFSPPG